jgi:hypothetical protein
MNTNLDKKLMTMLLVNPDFTDEFRLEIDSHTCTYPDENTLKASYSHPISCEYDEYMNITFTITDTNIVVFVELVPTSIGIKPLTFKYNKGSLKTFITKVYNTLHKLAVERNSLYESAYKEFETNPLWRDAFDAANYIHRSLASIKELDSIEYKMRPTCELHEGIPLFKHDLMFSFRYIGRRFLLIYTLNTNTLVVKQSLRNIISPSSHILKISNVFDISMYLPHVENYLSLHDYIKVI